MPSKAALKYEPLRLFLADFDASVWETTFSEIEDILQDQLPLSARKPRNYQSWWGNDASHVQARAWLNAGWSKDRVDLSEERVTFVRGDSGSREQRVLMEMTRTSNEQNSDGQSLSEEATGAISLFDYEFVHAAVVTPERRPDGSLIEITHDFPANTRLNSHGKGPFCRFRVQGLTRTAGVYAVTTDGALSYVGKADNLAERWGSNGYARIYARNCKRDGRSTNCKVNSYILREAREGRCIELWIHEDSNPKPIECSLILRLNPPWNGRKLPVTS